jgi:hypothetical protein
MKKIEKCCPVCFKNFFVPKCHQQRYVTCSYICGGIFRRKPNIENICEKCGKKFISKKSPKRFQRFCSRKCGTSVLIKGRDGNCLNCNKTIHIPPHREIGPWAKKCCSKECRTKYARNKSEKEQKPGNYRERAWRIYEKRCYDCGYDKRKEILIIHHIDNNRKNGKIENLLPLCQNCHAIRHLDMGGRNGIRPSVFRCKS